MNKTTTVSPLKLSQFRWLFSSNMAFFFAMGSQGIVRAWLAFKLTQSELALGTVTVAMAIPMFFIAPLGGVISDRMDRRNIIIVGQALVLGNELAITILLLFNKLHFWHLVCGAVLMGCIFPFIMPARTAIVVNIVGKFGIGRAIAVNMAGMNATRVIGPPAAGYLIDTIGILYTYIIGVILYGIGIICMFRVHKFLPPEKNQRASIGRSVIDGFLYVKENRLVLILLLFGLIPMFLAMPFQNLLVVFADKIWKVGSKGLGLLSALSGVGGVVGSICVAYIGNAKNRLGWMMVSMTAFGIFLLAFAFSPYFLLALPFVFLSSIFANIYGTMNNTAIHVVIPDHIRGRISSFLMMSFSLPLLGTFPVAALAELYSAPFAVGLASIMAMTTAFLFYFFSRSLREMNMSVERAMAD